MCARAHARVDNSMIQFHGVCECVSECVCMYGCVSKIVCIMIIVFLFGLMRSPSYYPDTTHTHIHLHTHTHTPNRRIIQWDPRCTHSPANFWTSGNCSSQK